MSDNWIPITLILAILAYNVVEVIYKPKCPAPPEQIEKQDWSK